MGRPRHDHHHKRDAVPPLLNPLHAPVVAIDTEGRPVAPGLLSDAAALRAHFEAPPVWEPEIRGERPFQTDLPLKPCAVLISVMTRPTLTVLFTRRAQHLSAHPGQISFPGGRVDPQDPNPPATALREAFEEVGLPRERAQVLGCMPDYTTGTGFVVTPVVALVDPGFTPVIDAAEVAEVFEIPLSFLMTPAHHHRHEIEWAGRHRTFWSIRWPQPLTTHADDYFIWGATAAMLRNLYGFLLAAGLPPQATPIGASLYHSRT